MLRSARLPVLRLYAKGSNMANIIIDAFLEWLLKEDREIRNSYEEVTGHAVRDLYKEYRKTEDKERAVIGGQLFEYYLFKGLYKIPGTRKFICNPYLPTKTGTTEVDVIMISSAGVFVFECKHYAGSIYGRETSRTWAYYLGGKKYTFYNPILQNDGHINALVKLLDLPRHVFFSKIVFPDFVKVKVDCEDPRIQVGLRSEVVRTVKRELTKNPSVLSDQQINSIYENLLPFCKADQEKKEAHIQRIQNQCPWCAGVLVLRKGKNGEFLGCSNYPKCRYTRSVVSDDMNASS